MEITAVLKTVPEMTLLFLQGLTIEFVERR